MPKRKRVPVCGAAAEGAPCVAIAGDGQKERRQQYLLLRAGLIASACIVFLVAELLTGFAVTRFFGPIAGAAIVMVIAPPMAAGLKLLAVRIRRRLMPTTVELLYSRYGLPVPEQGLLSTVLCRKSMPGDQICNNADKT